MTETTFHSSGGYTPASFTIRGHAYPARDDLILAPWGEAACRHGYRLRGRVRDRSTLVTECHECGTLDLAPLPEVLAGLPPCSACRNARVVQAEAHLGAVRVSADPAAPAAGIYRMPCGHHVHLTHDRIVAAAAGATGIDCAGCREAQYAGVALPCWELVGPAPSGDPRARLYRSRLDETERELTLQEAYGGVEGWDRGAPPRAPHEGSCLYLTEIPITTGPALKFGSSKRVKERIESLGTGCSFVAREDRALPLPRGDILRTEEHRVHRHMRDCHPDLVVPPDEIGPDITCVREVYRVAARPILMALMDEVEARYRHHDGRHGRFAPG